MARYTFKHQGMIGANRARTKPRDVGVRTAACGRASDDLQKLLGVLAAHDSKKMAERRSGVHHKEPQCPCLCGVEGKARRDRP
jgi:hypothetical protein